MSRSCNNGWVDGPSGKKVRCPGGHPGHGGSGGSGGIAPNVLVENDILEKPISLENPDEKLLAGNSATRNMETKFTNKGGQLSSASSEPVPVRLTREEERALLNSNNVDDVIYLAQYVGDWAPGYMKVFSTVYDLVDDEDMDVHEALLKNVELNNENFGTAMDLLQKGENVHPYIKKVAGALKLFTLGLGGELSGPAYSKSDDDFNERACEIWKKRVQYRRKTGRPFYSG